VPDPAVFLDRDGTLIEDVGYASRPEQIRILGGVARALADLTAAGYRLIVVTNQSGIARGYATEADLERFHQALDEQFHLLGAAVDAYYACPHHPNPGTVRRPDLAVDCNCRKPKPGLILRAAEDFGIDLAASWTVGDMWRDIAAGQAAGTRTIKLPADPEHDLARPTDVAPPTAEATDLAEAARLILEGFPEPATEPAAVEQAAPASAYPDVSSKALPAGSVPNETLAPKGEPDDVGSAAPDDEAEPLPPDAAGDDAGADTETADADAPAAEPPAPSAAPEPSIQRSRAARPAPEAAPPAAETRDPEPAAAQCARCGAAIPSADLADGTAAVRNGFLLCHECLVQQPREAAGGTDAPPDDVLQSILLELQRLRRSQRPSSLSALRILAYIVQAAALFFGFGLAMLGDDRTLYLEVALLLQLLVLALLLFERRS